MFALLTLWGVTVVIFVLLQLLPGDAATSLLGTQSGNPEALERMRNYLGLDRPAYIQYFVWMGDVLQGDLGISSQFRVPVSDVLWDKAKNSLILMAGSLVVMLGVGVPLGIASALRRNSLFDRGTMAVTLVAATMPVFLLGLLLMYAFALRWELFPASGMYSYTGERTLGSLLHHLVLPSISTAAISLAIIARVVRSTMVDVLNTPFMQALAARGIPGHLRILRHAVRHILPVTVNVSGLQVGWLFSGALFTEVIFSWPGIGRQIHDSVLARDVPMVISAALVTAVVFVLANLVADVVTVMLDPRRRAEL